MTPATSFATLDDQLPSMSEAHGLKYILCSAHLLESFDGRIYSLKHFNKHFYWAFGKNNVDEYTARSAQREPPQTCA